MDIFDLGTIAEFETPKMTAQEFIDKTKKMLNQLSSQRGVVLKFILLFFVRGKKFKNKKRLQLMKDIINGKELEYGDCIINNVTVFLGWKDRIRALFGKEISVRSEIYTKDPVNTLVTVSEASVAPIVLFTFPPEKSKPSDSLSTEGTMVPLRRITF